MQDIYGDIEDMPEEERWKLESAIESLTTAQSFEELQEEINEVDRIITRAREVEHLEVETKLQITDIYRSEGYSGIFSW